MKPTKTLLSPANDGTNMLSRILFHLAHDVYQNAPLSAQSREYFENNIAERGFFFVADSEKYLHPTDFSLVPISTFWETIKHDSSGIFCHRIEDTEGLTGYLVCSTCLGIDKRQEKIAAGFLYSPDKSRMRRVENIDYEMLAELKRFYGEFIGSSVVDKFINDESKFRYMVDPGDKTIISELAPSYIESDDIMMLSHRIVSENFLNQILTGKPENANPPILDSQIREFEISRIKLCNFNYALITFKLASIKMDRDVEYDMVIRNFSHKIRNKLTALQSAVEQLALQKGKMLDDDDLSLTKVIHNVSRNMDYMVGRLHQFGAGADLNFSPCNLNKVIQKTIDDKIEEFGKSAGISFSPSRSLELFIGDAARLEIALKELLDNAMDAVGEIGIVNVSVKDSANSISIIISNDVAETAFPSFDLGKTLHFEPFRSAKSDRSGMGISIARKIIAGHGGSLKIEKNRENRFLATIELPKTSIEETMH